MNLNSVENSIGIELENFYKNLPALIRILVFLFLSKKYWTGNKILIIHTIKYKKYIFFVTK